MKEKEVEGVDELFNKLKMWFPDWFKMLEEKYKKSRLKKQAYKRMYNLRHRGNKK